MALPAKEMLSGSRHLNIIARSWSQAQACVKPKVGQTLGDMTIGDLWNWFESHSLFGRAVPTYSCQLGSSTAFFVPLLSAMKIFTTSPVEGRHEGLHGAATAVTPEQRQGRCRYALGRPAMHVSSNPSSLLFPSHMALYVVHSRINAGMRWCISNGLFRFAGMLVSKLHGHVICSC
jgi:Protein of unknown function (DUF789)